MSDDKKILDSAKRIQRKFKTELEDPVEANDMAFIDEVNAHVKGLLGDHGTDIYTALSEERLEQWKKRKFRRFLRTLLSQRTLFFLLLAVITVFLMTEALSFYSVDGMIDFKTYVKAALTEICFIFLSGYRASGRLQTAMVGALRVSLFCLMLFVISSGVIFSGANFRSDISNLSSQITLIEQQIQAKEKEIDFYIKKDWPRNATQSRIAKEKLVDKLLELKQQQMDEKKNEDVSDLVLYQTWGRAAFRLILLFISVLLTRRLFRF